MSTRFTLFFAASLAAVGCQSQVPAVMVAAPTVSTTAPVPCFANADSPDRFVVDWPSDQRTALEIALKKGVVVLNVSCSTVRVLPDCAADGTYSYVATTEREDLISLADADEVNVNLPGLSGRLTGPSGVDFQHGGSVDIAAAYAGERGSSRAALSRAELKGECRDATHFVRGATMGAFAMGVGAGRQPKTVADVFSGSGRAQLTKDGSLEACRGAKPNAAGETAQCGAPVRVQLESIRQDIAPVVEGKLADAPACPAGMVQGEAGDCEKPRANRPHLCAPSDVADCAQQCERGSPTSCAILGRSYQLGRGVPQDLARASELLSKACAGGGNVACGRLGEMALASRDEEKGLRLLTQSCSGGWTDGCWIAGSYLAAYIAKQHPTTEVRQGELFQRACLGGRAEACSSLGALYEGAAAGGAPDYVEAANWYRLACDGGARHGCTQYAVLLDKGRGVPADPARAVALLTASCDAGYATACGQLSNNYFGARAVARDDAKGMALLLLACKLGEPESCFNAGNRLSAGIAVTKDQVAADTLWTKACDTGFKKACGLVQKK